MDELAERRKRLFSGADFSSAVFYNEDASRVSPSFCYFSGCDADGAYLVLKKGGGVVICHRMNYRMARETSRYHVKMSGKDGAAPLLRRACGRGRAGVAATEMSAKIHGALKGKVKLKLADADERILSVRSEKSASELVLIAEAAKIARRILDGLDPWECETEEELSAKLKIAALKAGAEVSFEPIVATGRNSSFPHHHATKKRLGDAVLVDFGVEYQGYCSDFTRCYFRKKRMKEEETYGKCVAVFEGILEGLDGCKTGKDVAVLAEKLVKKEGLPKMIHSIGHGVGLEVHEFPRLWGRSKDSLEGAVLAIEPAAYFSNYGVRFEDMAVNTKKGWKKA